MVGRRVHCESKRKPWKVCRLCDSILTSAYFSWSNPRTRDVLGVSQAGRAHNVRDLTGSHASGYIKAVWRVAVITPSGVGSFCPGGSSWLAGRKVLHCALLDISRGSVRSHGDLQGCQRQSNLLAGILTDCLQRIKRSMVWALSAGSITQLCAR